MKQKIYKLFLIGIVAVGAYRAYEHFLQKNPFRSSEAFSLRFTDLLVEYALLALLLAAVWGQIGRNREDQPDDAPHEADAPQPATLRRMILGGIGGALLVMVAMILLYNPRDLYFTQLSLKPVTEVRHAKLEVFRQLDYDPEVMVFGTSRTLSISPAHITDVTGYSAFNMGLTSGYIDDVKIFLEYTLDHQDVPPKVIIVETSPQLPRSSPSAHANQDPFEVIKYLEPNFARSVYIERFLQLFNIYQFSEATYLFRRSVIRGQELKPNSIVLPDGYTETFRAEEPFLELIQRQLENVPPPYCQGIPENRTEIFGELISLAYENDIAVVVLIAPWEGHYYDQFVEGAKKYDQCYQAFLGVIADLEKQYDNIYVANHVSVESFNGLQGEAGFYDAHHMTPENSNLLIDAMVPLIEAAYQWALQAGQ